MNNEVFIVSRQTDISDGTIMSEREALGRAIVAACRDMDEEYLEIERDFQRANEELHRDLDAW